MSKEKNEHKKTFRLGGTKVTTYLPEDHPVYKGVIHAMEVEGGQFPEHVGHIVIKPDIVPSSKNNHFVGGNCSQTNQGRSKINIFAGSINETVDSFLVEPRATNVTLHEIRHSLRNKEIQEGLWLDETPSEKWEEEDAEAYVREAHSTYQKKKAEGKPRLTFKQLLEIKRQQNQ